MAKRILNKSNCTFICPALQGTVTKTQLNPTFNDGTGDALTTKTALSGNGICSVLTASAGGTPTPCTLKMASNWISGFEMKKKINGISLLNEDAKMPCPVGNMITVQKPLPPIISVNIGVPLVNNGVGTEKNTSDENSLQSENSSVSGTANNKIQDIDLSEKENFDEPKTDVQTEDDVYQQKGFCHYDSCGKADACPYMQALSTIVTNGAAIKLRNNSKQKELKYNECSERNMEKYQISWNNQAHHLISVNAAYCQYPELVKLGNYFGYDINCEENCCFLPCWESGDGYGQKNSHFKKAQAYEVMKASGMQWHVGQHTYVIPENIKEKYPELKTLDCYNVKINEKVDEILAACHRQFNGKCLEENYEENKRWFVKQMNTLSEEIEEHLDLFSKDPKKSYPYFVSAEALRYAYEVPRSGKVILIYPTKTQWIVKRYRYTNYLKDDDIQLNLLATQALAVAENHRTETIKKLIMFCENVSCFLIVDEKGMFALPFGYQVKYQYISNEESEKVKSHFSAMLAEQADSGEDEYVSPKAMAVKRLKECGLV